MGQISRYNKYNVQYNTSMRPQLRLKKTGLNNDGFTIEQKYRVKQ